MWTTKNRGRYDRSRLRYPSDLTDDEWARVAPLIPPAKRGGNKRSVDVREVMNGIMYVLSTGCQWRAVPKDLPARSTLFDYLDLWSWDGSATEVTAPPDEGVHIGQGERRFIEHRVLDGRMDIDEESRR